MDTKLFTNFELKALNEEEGTFEGYASIFDKLDRVGDIVLPGAFTKSLKEDATPSVLWQHEAKQVIGSLPVIKEDNIGLFVKVKLTLQVQLASEVYALLKDRAIKSMSMGYVATKVSYNEDRSIRYIIEAKVFEVSVVTFAANEQATIISIKSGEVIEEKKIQDFIELKECEAFLKTKICSNMEAKAIISKITEIKNNQREVVKDIQRDVEEINKEQRDVDNTKEVLNLIKNFNKSIQKI